MDEILKILKQSKGKCDDNQTVTFLSPQFAHIQAINADTACDVAADGHVCVARLPQWQRPSADHQQPCQLTHHHHKHTFTRMHANQPITRS